MTPFAEGLTVACGFFNAAWSIALLIDYARSGVQKNAMGAACCAAIAGAALRIGSAI